jgi:hypothetical protein
MVGLAGLLLGAHGATAKTSTPKVSRLTLSPKSLPGSGGSAFIKVKVTGTGITNVQAQAQVAGSSGGRIVALNKSGTTYSGGVPVPGNFRTTKATATVYVHVTYGSGQVMQKTIGSISLAPYDNTLPPPPPPN